MYKATYRINVCPMSSALLKRLVLSTSAMRPLKRSTIPLVLGVLGLVNRCSMSSAWQSRSNSCSPLGSRALLAVFVKKDGRLIFKQWMRKVAVCAVED